MRAFVDSPRAADIDLIIRLPGEPATSGAGEVTQTATVRFGTDALLHWNLDVRLPIELPQQTVQVEIEAVDLRGDTTVLKVLNFCAAALADGSAGCNRFAEIVMDVKIIPIRSPLGIERRRNGRERPCSVFTSARSGGTGVSAAADRSRTDFDRPVFSLYSQRRSRQWQSECKPAEGWPGAGSGDWSVASQAGMGFLRLYVQSG